MAATGKITVPVEVEVTEVKKAPSKAPLPSVGRIVHYTTDPHATVKAAIITGVLKDSERQYVDLVIFNDAGAFAAGTPIPFAEAYTPGHWSWPPRP